MCFAMIGRQGIEPPSQPDYRLQLSPWRDIYRPELERTKSRRAFLEEYIETMENDLREIPAIYTPKEALRVQQRIAHWRVYVQFMKRWEQELELWEQQQKVDPGLETDRKALDRLERLRKEWDVWENAQSAGRIAPMPREKK
jgi:hypothetical protein